MDRLSQSKILYSSGNDSWHPLPKWSMDYIALGQVIARTFQSGTRMVVGLALPTRSYCAVLISLGIVLQRDKKSRKSTGDTFFDYCCSLEKGTPITFRHSNKTYKGVFLRCFDKDGNKTIEIEYKIGSRPSIRSDISAVVALEKVHILDEFSKTSLDKLTGRGIAQNKFLEEFYSLFLNQKHQIGSRLDVYIIGQLNTLRAEVRDSKVAVSNKNIIAGTLQDVLRIKRYCRNNEYYRSMVFTPDSSLLDITNLEHAPFVVFDGAASFIKCRDTFEDSSWIVVLDKADSNLAEAAGILNEDFYKYGGMSEFINSCPQIDGVEYIAFQEVINETHIS